MNDERVALLTDAAVEIEAGMLTSAGRVLDVRGDAVLAWDPDAGAREVPRAGLVPDLEDRATRLLCLEQLAQRVGLDPAPGLLWYLDDGASDGPIWVLEGSDEVRTRDGDTADPALSLARALAETAPVRG